MRKMTIGEAQRLTAPNPFCLIGTLRPDGGTNLTAISWWNYLSNKELALSVAISRKSWSNELIKATGVFTLNVVAEGMEEAAFSCGTCSGRSKDKAKEFGIVLEPGHEGEPSMVTESVVSFFCRLKETVEVGDHTLFIADIERIVGNPKKRALFAVNGYTALKAFSS